MVRLLRTIFSSTMWFSVQRLQQQDAVSCVRLPKNHLQWLYSCRRHVAHHSVAVIATIFACDPLKYA